MYDASDWKGFQRTSFVPIIIDMFNQVLCLWMIAFGSINVRINTEDEKLKVVELQVGE